MIADSIVGSEDIEEAQRTIAGHVRRTSLVHSTLLSPMVDCELYLKMENLQMTGSFKERGAANILSRLPAADRARGIVAASAGNHAQGVAYHAQRLGLDATIVMPEYTPLIKVTSTRRFGANVVLEGRSYDDAYGIARDIEARENRHFIHPFNDPDIIAGQGTIGLELVAQNPELEAVVVPVGGGGLIAGVALAIKGMRPDIAIYGVEAEAMPSMHDSVKAGEPVEVPVQTTLADGMAVRCVGDLTFEVVRRHVDDIVTVSEEEIASALLTLLEVEKTVVEGCGAAPLAAVMNGRLPVAGKNVALILSGGNIDVTMLSRVIERGLVKNGRVAQLAVTIPDTPGSLSELTGVIAAQRGNVLDIRHDRAFLRGPLGTSMVTITLGARGHEHIAVVTKAIEAAGMGVKRD